VGDVGSVEGGDIYIRNADGTGSVNVTNSDLVSEHNPAWSPDGTRLAFSRLSFDGGAFEQAFIVSASGGEPTRLLSDSVEAELIKWSPDGSRLLFLRTGTLCTVRPDGTDVRALTPDSLLVFSASWSPDGTRIAFEGLDSALYIVSSEGGEPVDIAAGLEFLFIRSVAWSPDGSRIAFIGSRRGEGGIDIGIFTIGPDGQGLTVITDSVVSPASPTWSPDGTKLAFTLESVPRDPPPNGGFGETEVIYIMNADGSGARPLTGINETAGDPAWGP
jgi:Tol biopolymer transport system component